MLAENNRQRTDNSDAMSRLRNWGNTARKVPLAAEPSRARLTVMKAKWYHWATENTLVRAISKTRVAAESRNTAKSRMLMAMTIGEGGVVYKQQ
jgi:hypothetical protein